MSTTKSKSISVKTFDSYTIPSYIYDNFKKRENASKGKLENPSTIEVKPATSKEKVPKNTPSAQNYKG